MCASRLARRCSHQIEPRNVQSILITSAESVPRNSWMRPNGNAGEGDGHALSSLLHPGTSELEDDWPESIFRQVLIQLRRHLSTSLRRACLRAAMLSVYGHMRAPSHHPTFLSNCAARILTKVVCASCVVPGCCAQVALCKLLRARALCKLLCASALSKLLCASALRQLLRASALRMCSAQVGLCKLLCASALCNWCCRSCGGVLRVLRLYLKVAILRPELRGCAPRTTFVLKSCDFSSLSCGSTLRILRLYLKIAIFHPELQEHAPYYVCA